MVLRPNGLRDERPEERLGSIAGTLVVRADDLRQRSKLFEGMALGDPFRTKCDINLASTSFEVLADVRGRAGIDRAAQDHQRSLTEVRRDLIDRPLEDRHRWSEELVDGGPHHDDELVGAPHHLAAGSEFEPVRGEDTTQEFVSAVFEEGHLTRSDSIQRRLVGVVDTNTQPGVGEGQAQGQADVTAAAEDDDVEIVGGHRWHSSSVVLSVTASIVLVRRCQ